MDEVALTLNQIPDHLRGKLPPTDARFRPDMRLMEEGDFAQATKEKHRME